VHFLNHQPYQSVTKDGEALKAIAELAILSLIFTVATIVMKFFIRLVFTIVLLSTGFTVRAQDLLKANNLSQISIDRLTDADILKYQQQLAASGITQQQAEQIAISKGMPQTEINKLRDRLSKLTASSGTANGDTSRNASTTVTRQAAPADFKTYTAAPSKEFGAQLFTTPSLSFEPNLRIATPLNYVLGPDDELLVVVFGYQEATYRLQVSPEGSVVIPQVGVMQLSGLSIEEATKRIKDKLAATRYVTLKSGQSSLTVSLSKIRNIHVTVLGANKPGNYTVSSLTTLYNLLYLCGGPDSKIGSYREIEVIRNNKTHIKADLYDFLLKGDLSANILLKENDVVNIHIYKSRVNINGEVMRPGTYEALAGESLEDIIRFAGGFTERAYTASVKINQLTEKGHSLRDIAKAGFKTYYVQKADDITVDAVLDKYENRVTINGAVYRPGQYELTQGLTLKALLTKTDGLKEDAFLQRGVIVRTNDDLVTKENIPFDLRAILNGTAADITLKKEDVITISSITEFRDVLQLSIAGEVRKPGIYEFNGKQTLKGLLFQAGGVTASGTLYKIEIARRISNASNRISDTIAQVIELNADADFTLTGNDYALQPFDRITVRRNPAFVIQKQVAISGEVVYPGNYTLETKKDRISDLIKKAGGFTSTAFAEGVYLIRNNNTVNDLQTTKKEVVQNVQKSIKDSSSSVIQSVTNATTRIAINAEEVLQKPGSASDLILEEGDEIHVMKFESLVKMSGEVFKPTKTDFVNGEGIKYYIGKAGGFTDNARRSKTYVIYANSAIGRTRHFLFSDLILH